MSELNRLHLAGDSHFGEGASIVWNERSVNTDQRGGEKSCAG